MDDATKDKIRRIMDAWGVKITFRTRGTKLYATLTGKFSHSTGVQLRNRIADVLGNRVVITSGAFSVSHTESKITLRLNPDK